MAKKTVKMTLRERTVAILKTMKLSYETAPLMVVLQVIGAILSAVLPIVTSYFAALTTTALAQAYAGDSQAGRQAMTYVVITVGLGIVMTAWHSLEQYFNELMRYKVDAAVEDRMIRNFLELDFWQYDDKETADLYDKASRFASRFPFMFSRFTGLMTAFAGMVAGLSALMFVNWWLGLILIAAVIPGIYIQVRLSRAQTAHWNKTIEARRKASEIGWMLGRPSYIAELRLYGLIRHLLSLHRYYRDKDQKDQIEYERRYIFKRLAADAVQAGAEVLALLVTVSQIISRVQPIGQFIYVQQVVSRALGGANGFIISLNSIDEDLANLYDYQTFLELPKMGKSGNRKLDQSPQTIEFHHVSFRYHRTDHDALKDISLTIRRGQHVAIVGENGAGKTTLIKLLTGIYAPTAGSILLDGSDLRSFDME